MRMFYCLTFDAHRDDLMTVEDYVMENFDLTSFWKGKSVAINIPPSVKLYCDNDGYTRPDYVGNPISWPICSLHFVDLIRSMATDDVEFFDAPLFDRSSGDPLRGYQIMNVIRTVPCMDLEQSKLGYSLDGSRITAVYEHVFKASAVPKNVHVFRPKEWLNSIVFSDELAQSLVGKELSGIAFIRTRST